MTTPPPASVSSVVNALASGLESGVVNVFTHNTPYVVGLAVLFTVVKVVEHHMAPDGSPTGKLVSRGNAKYMGERSWI